MKNSCQWKEPKQVGRRWVYLCPFCKRTLSLRHYEQPERLHRFCTAPLKLPSNLRRIGNFSIASVKHLLRRMPTATQEKIDERNAICQQCPFLKNDICAHKNCGCGVNNKGGFINKLAWADSQCPDDPPRWGRVD